MKLCKMIEIYLKYDNMHTIGVINAFICINNYVNSCINCMLSLARGFTQLYDIDYTETFSLVVRLNSVCMLLSLAVHQA